MKAASYLAVITILLLSLLLGGCGSTLAYKPPKPLPPVMQPASVTPAAADTAAAVASMQQPLQSLQTAAPTLTAQNVDQLRPSIVTWVGAIADAWQRATASAQRAQADAKANDDASAAVMAAVKARDAEIADLSAQATKLNAQVQADKTEFQKKINAYAIILTVIVAVVVGLLVYMTQLKAAICTAIGGTGAILFLLALGWVDKFKVEIGLGFILAGLAYLAAETVYRHFHNKLTWWPAFLAALSESPTAA